LDLTVGGINPAAVTYMTKVKGGWGRIVGMPSFEAENQVRDSNDDRLFVRVSHHVLRSKGRGFAMLKNFGL
jgi:hypothetical protein